MSDLFAGQLRVHPRDLDCLVARKVALEVEDVTSLLVIIELEKKVLRELVNERERVCANPADMPISQPIFLSSTGVARPVVLPLALQGCRARATGLHLRKAKSLNAAPMMRSMYRSRLITVLAVGR